jgi:multiple antibiotic resistance protein
MPSERIAFALLVFTSLLAIVNPVSAVPLYLSVTHGYDGEHRRTTLRAAILTSVAVLVAFAFVGTWILQFFGITTNAFRITGGLLFLAVGSDMLEAKRSRESTTAEEEEEAAGRTDEVGIIPLGIPTLAGPGAITTVITLNAQAERLWQRAVVLGAIIVVMIVSWIVLGLAPAILRRFGQTGLNVLTRIMGLIVMVIGTQFIIDGVRAVVLETTRGAA